MSKEAPKVSACALAAAYMALTGGDTKYDGERLLKSFPILGAIEKCPEKGCSHGGYVSDIIMHMNDRHMVTREHIAGWVSELEKKEGNAPQCQADSAAKLVNEMWKKDAPVSGTEAVKV